MIVNFSSIPTSINGYTLFRVVIFAEGLNNLAQFRNITVNQIQNWKEKYIKVQGILEIYQYKELDAKTPQIIVNSHHQISLISETETDILLGASLKSIIKVKYIDIANIYLKLNNLFDISKNSHEDKNLLILFQMFLCFISFPAIGFFYTSIVELTYYINKEEGLLAIIGLLFLCGGLLFFIGLLTISCWFVFKNID